MIIMKIWGGLGNQLFQYALGRKLSLAKNIELKLDTSQYRTDTRRHYDIHRFNIAGSLSNRIELAKFKFFNVFDSSKPYYKRHVVQEQGFFFDPNIFNVSNNSYIQGYWQSEKYFKDIENIIRKDITLKEPQDQKYLDILYKIRNSNSVSLHVRRADYLSARNTKIFAKCSPDYYKQAVEIIANRVGEPKLFIFSDEIDWVKKNLSFPFQVEYVSANKYFADYDCQELTLMSACKHNVTANSSFSWWGAWLNSNLQKIVVIPDKWVVDTKREAKDVVPDSWIRL